MLVNVEKSGDHERYATGVYLAPNTGCAIGMWNFELYFRGRQDFKKDFPDFGLDFGCYGVCDSPEQLLSKLPENIKTSETQYVISMVRLNKKDQPNWGGWRWHKWGEYIGVQEPQCEYLYNEPVIETVWTYHIYEV